ncbi:MAG: ABC transporter permease [Deltaproteobacteria bacterium]|jgi:NitT/TauT family transport system permease protein|nr:ABC transporter permease [Deltaproteobacteria bacterium]
MKLSPKKALTRPVTRYGLLALLVIVWELSGRFNLVDQSFLPSFSETIATTVVMFQKSFLFTHTMVSLTRVMIGLCLAVVSGTILSYLLGRVLPSVGWTLEPLFRVFGLINPYCLFPLLVVFFGLGEAPKILILAWVALWPVFFSSLAGLKDIDPALLQLARSMGASKIQIFYKVIIPATAPSIFNGARIGVEMAFFILIAAEMTGATAGLGWIVHNAGALYQVSRIYASGLIIVLLGFTINRFLIFVRDGLFFWGRASLSGRDSLLPQNRTRISPLTLKAVTLTVAVVIGLGIYQIIMAEAKLNDPTVIPEYRVWTE